MLYFSHFHPTFSCNKFSQDFDITFKLLVFIHLTFRSTSLFIIIIITIIIIIIIPNTSISPSICSLLDQLSAVHHCPHSKASWTLYRVGACVAMV